MLAAEGEMRRVEWGLKVKVGGRRHWGGFGIVAMHFWNSRLVFVVQGNYSLNFVFLW